MLLHFGLVKSVDNLQGHWISLYSGKFDRKFVTHGDLWINNIMVKNNSDEAIILDWQTLCPDHPVFDVAFLLCTSLTPQNLENWTDDLIKFYRVSHSEECKVNQL
jgi:thiamine kinase-like enzyme